VGLQLGIGHGVAAVAGVVLLMIAMGKALSGTLSVVALVLASRFGARRVSAFPYAPS
jgi:hypothetical protein